MGRIWLTSPLGEWHYDHTNPNVFNASLLTMEQFELTHQKWHNWWTADWDYGQPTIAFFCAGIALLALFNSALSFRSRRSRRSSVMPRETHPSVSDRLIALGRYTVASQFRIRFFDWYSPPLGAIIVVTVMLTFIMGLTFAVKPYYWPNMNMGHSQPLATRCGWISMAIMPFMIAFAMKVNFVGLLTGTSHEKLQVFHRWSAFFMYITSLIHTFPFIVKCIEWGEMELKWNTSQSYWTGVAALVPQTYLIFMSWGFFRNRYYETFKKLHYIASTIFMVALFIHVDWIQTSWDYFWGTLAMFMLGYFIRMFRIFYNSHLTGLPATAELVSSGTVKLTIPVGERLRWSPGQHVFVRCLNLGIHSFSSHPFTITSITAPAPNQAAAENPCPSKTHDEGISEGITLELVFRVHNGFTKTLARRLEGKVSVGIGRVWIDGPYGGMTEQPKDFDHVYLFAGGSGVSFTLPLLMDLVRQLEKSEFELRCKHIEFILAVRNSDILGWLEQPLVRAGAAGVSLRVHVTGTAESADHVESKLSPAESITSELNVRTPISGRPDVATIVAQACQSDRGRIAVAACGPSSFMYDLRNAVADAQLVIADGYGRCTDLFLHTESYAW